MRANSCDIRRMDTVSSLSTFRPAIGDSAIATPSPRPMSETDAPSPRRSRAKKLTAVNRSSRIGKRIDELKALFTEALGEDALTPMRRMRITEAAELKALAEKARGDYLRGEGGNLAEVVSAERRADQAVRGLGIVEETRARPKLSLLAQMAEGAR